MMWSRILLIPKSILTIREMMNFFNIKSKMSEDFDFPHLHLYCQEPLGKNLGVIYLPWS